MAPPRPFSYGLVIFTIFFTQISALTVKYCSSLNTAQTHANSSIFQSNGLCYNFCLDNWAFAILQVDDCYCSNEAPGITTPLSDCNFPCHGYPNDLCGSLDGLFGYMALTNSPTATVDGSSSAAASSTRASQVTVTDTPSATTVFDTKTETPSPSSPSTSSSFTTPTTPSTLNLASTSSSSSVQTTSSSSSTSTWSPTPVTSLETVTGQVRTITVTPTIPPSSQSLTGVKEKNGGGGIGIGGAVGLTIGLVALVALICSIIYFCIRKRQKERRAEAEAFTEESRRGSSAGLGGPIPSRTMSENSRYLLGTDGRQVVETWEPDSQDAPGSRKSRLMPVDPRLDPHATLYQRGENKSRESVNTIRDDHDYSRRFHQQGPILRATNPDD